MRIQQIFAILHVSIRPVGTESLNYFLIFIFTFYLRNLLAILELKSENSRPCGSPKESKNSLECRQVKYLVKFNP